MRAKILGAVGCVAAALALNPCVPAQAQGAGASRMQPYDEEAYRNARPVIAVEEFQARDARSSAAVAGNMRALLIHALERDGRFAVVRGAWDAEDDGPDILIEGTVTDYRAAPAKGGMQSADIDISLEVVDATTGESVGRVRASGSGSGAASGLAATDAETFGDTALGRASAIAASMAIPKIAEILRQPE